MSGMTKRRVLYIATAVAMMGISGGFVLAATLTSTSVTQTAALYSVSSSAAAAFPTSPAASVSFTPASVAACTSSSVSLASGGTANVYLGASSGVTCTTNDFAELLTVTSSATAASGTYTFTVYNSYGAGPTNGAATGTITIASTLSSAGTVNIYVDYGAVAPPTSITSLSLVVA